MPTNTPDQGIVIPQGADLADVVAMVASMIAGVESRLALRYADAADRLARHAVAVEGQYSDLAAENWADAYNGATWISAAARGHRAYKARTTDAAPINNSAALVSDATLNAPIAAAGVFIWGGDVYYDAAAAADLKLAFTWPGAPTASRWGGMGRNATTTTNIDAQVTTVSAGTQAWGALGVGVPTWMSYRGILVNTGVAGNLQMQYAQQTADPSNLVVRAGTSLWTLQIA